MRKFVVFTSIWCSLTCMPGVLFAQPKSDLYLFSLLLSSDSLYHVLAPRYLSGFNERGISDEPSFTPSGDLLISVKKEGETQYDIWQLLLSQKKIKRLTFTQASEYSPQITPDGQHLSFLRKATLGAVDQQLYQVGLTGKDLKSLEGDIRDVVNYTWMSSHELGLYRVAGEENALSYLNLTDLKTKPITTSVGKTILTDKVGRLVYVHQFNPDYWYIKKYIPSSTSIEVVAETPGKVDDFAMAPDGTYFIGKGHLLYSMNPAYQTTWKEVVDLSVYGINFITGLAVSDDGHQLALVATKEKQ